MWSVHWKFKPSEYKVTVQVLDKFVKNVSIFPQFQIPLFPSTKFYRSHKLYAYSDKSCHKVIRLLCQTVASNIPHFKFLSAFFCSLGCFSDWIRPNQRPAASTLHSTACLSHKTHSKDLISHKRSTMMATALIMLCFYFIYSTWYRQKWWLSGFTNWTGRYNEFAEIYKI